MRTVGFQHGEDDDEVVVVASGCWLLFGEIWSAGDCRKEKGLLLLSVLNGRLAGRVALGVNPVDKLGCSHKMADAATIRLIVCPEPLPNVVVVDKLSWARKVWFKLLLGRTQE